MAKQTTAHLNQNHWDDRNEHDLPEVFGGQWTRGESIVPPNSTGQADLFIARRKRDGRAVALKVICGNDDAAHQRFEIEISAMQRCDGSSNIVRYIDSGYEDWKGRRIAWIVMELIERPRSLTEYLHDRRLDNDPLPPRTLVQHLRDLARALHKAHQAGVIHRDLKPQNVLVGIDGVPKICDFGLALPILAPGTKVAHDPGKNSIVGTWQYMSPEHVSENPDAAIGAASDLYAFGVLAYEALTGARPFSGSLGALPTEQARHIIQNQPPRPILRHEPRIGEDLAYIVHRCLEKDPARRYQSAAELANDLDDALRARPLRSRLESTRYALRHHLRNRMIRHRRALTLLVLIIAGLIGFFVVNPAIRYDTFASFHYQEALQRLPLPARAMPPLDDVRIVSFVQNIPGPDNPDAEAVFTPYLAQLHETDFERIRAVPGLELVNTDGVFSRRPALGMAFARIAEAGARIVVNDYSFITPSEPRFDEPLIEGIRACHAAGVPFVQVIFHWTRTPHEVDRETGIISLAREIAEPAGIERFGTATAINDPWLGWLVDLAIKQYDSPWMPSLTLASYAAWHGFDPNTPIIADHLRARLYLQAPVHFDDQQPRINVRTQASTITSEIDKDDTTGVQYKDSYAMHHLVMPDDQAIAEMTFNLDDVLTAEPDTLRTWFEGKAVFVGHIDPLGTDYFGHPGDRFLPGVVASAVSFATQQSGTPVLQYSQIRALILETAIGGVLGCLIVLMTRTATKRILLLVIAAACFVLISAALYSFAMRIFFPTHPIITMLLSALLTLGVISPWRYRHEYLAHTRA